MNSGGFTSPNKFGSPSASQQSPSSGGKQQNQAMFPVTVKQLAEAKMPDSMNFEIDGKPVAQVKLVGLILQVDVKTTCTTYMVDDGTGMISVKIFSTTDGAQDAISTCREDTYVEVYGNVRAMGGQRSVVAFHIKPVTDFNVITLHSLDVIHTHLKNTKGPIGGGMGAAAAQSANPMMATVSSNNYAADAGGDAGGMEQDHAKVLKAFEQLRTDDERGTSVNEILQKLPGMDMSTIRQAVEFLSGEGHLYSTVDEDHWKCTSE